jgi:RNA polymerase sigma-70 factor (ECF subfamily)
MPAESLNPTSGAETGPHCFATTHWSVVLAAGSETTPSSQAALETLCRTYWYPLYAYVRRCGYSPEDAKDLTQEFFVRLLEKGSLARADQNRGKFRTFLLASIKNFLINEQQKKRAAKRGGGESPFSIEADLAEGHYGREPRDPLSPEKQFERGWASTLIEQGLQKLRLQYAQQGNQPLFERLKIHLWGEDSASYAEIAEEFEMNEGAVKAAAFRLRRQLGQTLRSVIAETVTSSDEVEEELKSLIETFSS